MECVRMIRCYSEIGQVPRVYGHVSGNCSGSSRQLWQDSMVSGREIWEVAGKQEIFDICLLYIFHWKGLFSFQGRIFSGCVGIRGIFSAVSTFFPGHSSIRRCFYSWSCFSLGRNNCFSIPLTFGVFSVHVFSVRRFFRGYFFRGCFFRKQRIGKRWGGLMNNQTLF